MGRDGKLIKCTPEELERITKQVVDPMASDGLRTICLAYKDYVPSIPLFENQVQSILIEKCISGQKPRFT